MAARKHRRVGDSPPVRRTLIGLAVALTVLLLFMPLVLIFVQESCGAMVPRSRWRATA